MSILIAKFTQGAAVFFVAVFLLSPVAVSAAEIASDRLDSIRDHCASAQSILQQQQRRDAVSRINRGRGYDLVLRQVDAMNSRLAYNKIQTDDLIGITNELQGTIDGFRSAYTAYDQGLLDAIAINCREKPTDFYQLIERAQSERQLVGEAIKRIEGLLEQYRKAIVDRQGAL